MVLVVVVMLVMMVVGDAGGGRGGVSCPYPTLRVFSKGQHW